MRIGIDVDDTITNTYEYVVDEISKFYKVDKDELLSRNLTYDEFFNSEEFPNYSIFAEERYEKCISNVGVKKDAIKYISKLYEEGNEIVIITARHVGEYNNPYEITQNYLFKHNIPYDKIIVNAFDKGKVCEEENIDLFIDDSITNCLRVQEFNVDTLLFDAPFNRHFKDIRRVNNWEEVYNIINDSQ